MRERAGRHGREGRGPGAAADDGEHDGDSCDGDHVGDLGDAGAGASGPSGLCWAGRTPPVGPRQEAFTLAGGPMVWERAPRHGPGGRGPAADAGAADGVEPDGDLGRGGDGAEHDDHLGDAEPDGDLGWGT